MIYFTKEIFEYLSDLAGNNNRDWFNTNKSRYLEHVKEPFELFIWDLIEALQPHFESLTITPKEAIFRIYRDVRFSKDKSPYKTKVSALITKGGRKNMTSPGMYIEILPDEARVYSGLYQLSTKQLHNVRMHISYNLEQFGSLIQEPQFLKTFGEVRGEKNKRIAKEFEEDALEQPLMFNKSFYYFSKISLKTMMSPHVIRKMVDTYLIAEPLSLFLYEGIQD